MSGAAATARDSRPGWWSRPRTIGVVAIVAAGAVFALRPADARVADPAQHIARLDHARLRLALAAAGLEELAAELASSLGVARTGASSVLAGDDDPGAMFAVAADRWRAAEPGARHVTTLVDGARTALAAAGCAGGGTLSSIDAGALPVVADALDDAGRSASAVVAIRRATEDVLAALERALSALRRGDAAGARRAHVDAVTRLATAEALYVEQAAAMPTATLWFDGTRRVIDAVGAMAAATARGDARALEEATRAYADAAAEADLADRALGVALAEGTTAATGPALAVAGRTASEAETAASAAEASAGSLAAADACG